MHKKDYLEITPEAPWVRAKDLIPNLAIIETEDSETGRVVTPWRVLGGG